MGIKTFMFSFLVSNSFRMTDSTNEIVVIREKQQFVKVIRCEQPLDLVKWSSTNYQEA